MFWETFKNFTINFDALNEAKRVSSGSLITGNISFTLKKETAISSVVMEVRGLAHVHWTVGGKRKRRIFDKQDIFLLKDVVLRNAEDPQRTVRLPPGTHVFPFTCQLPVGDFPSSYSSANANIKYSVVVRVFRPWHSSKDIETQLDFVNYLNTNQPELWRPLEGTNEMQPCYLWCASGPIRLTARIERKAFRVGEIVKVTCNVSNGSSRTVTPRVKLQQKRALHAQNGSRNLTVFNTLSSTAGDPVSGYTSLAQTEILLTIPSTALTIANCSLLEMVYHVVVSLSRMASPSLTVVLPIILYDIPATAHHAVLE